MGAWTNGRRPQEKANGVADQEAVETGIATNGIRARRDVGSSGRQNETDQGYRQPYTP